MAADRPALNGCGAVFVLFYTWPLKYIGLGEMAVMLIWGPLMVGGGYFVITGQWDWNVVIASLPYALGPTTVSLASISTNCRKMPPRKSTPCRYSRRKGGPLCRLGMMALMYVLVIVLVITGFFSPVMLVVLFALTGPAAYGWKLTARPNPASSPPAPKAPGRCGFRPPLFITTARMACCICWGCWSASSSSNSLKVIGCRQAGQAQ